MYNNLLGSVKPRLNFWYWGIGNSQTDVNVRFGIGFCTGWNRRCLQVSLDKKCDSDFPTTNDKTTATINVAKSCTQISHTNLPAVNVWGLNPLLSYLQICICNWFNQKLGTMDKQNWRREKCSHILEILIWLMANLKMFSKTNSGNFYFLILNGKYIPHQKCLSKWQHFFLTLSVDPLQSTLSHVFSVFYVQPLCLLNCLFLYLFSPFGAGGNKCQWKRFTPLWTDIVEGKWCKCFSLTHSKL